MNSNNITIIGAGLVGSLLSIFLKKKGYNVNVYERRSDIRTSKNYQGRSINLALSDRGWQALKAINIDKEIFEIAIPMYSRAIHDLQGNITNQAYGKENQAIYSVSRAEINKKLMTLAEQQGVNFYFDYKCTDVDFENTSCTFSDINDKTIQVHSKLIFGSDGAFANTRLSKQLKTERFEYNQFYINCSYKELSIAANSLGEFQLQKNALHIWPRGNFMMIALPNLDGSFTCTLFIPYTGENSFEKLNNEHEVKDFFNKNFPSILMQMPNFCEEFFQNPTSQLVTVKCFPWVNKNNFSLIGDAAHAIVPFFGQGMNCGFEDCLVLDSLIEKHEHNWSEILPEFESLRKPDADAIADLAIENFNEMSSKVADPSFLLQKKIEAYFANKFPEHWIPAYSMVTFSPHIRYSEALAKGQKQDKIMKQILKENDIENTYQSLQIQELLFKLIEQNA
jgi:kynurenine 3-monooxygenase